MAPTTFDPRDSSAAGRALRKMAVPFLAAILFAAALVAGGGGALATNPPTANAGGPYTGDEGDTITFVGSAFDPEQPSNQLTYAWDFDFGGSFSVDVSGVNLSSTSHVYADNGVFTVALRVTDEDSNQDISTADVTVANVAPLADAGGAYTVDEGTALTFAGSATDPGNDTLTYEWDFDYDGANFAIDTSGENLTGPSNTYANDGQKTVALRVRDDDGDVSAIVTDVVTVDNVPPTANAGASYSGDEGAEVTFSGSATDPGNDTLTFEWDFDSSGSFLADQSGDALTSPKHVYPNDGDFTLELRVRDDDTVSAGSTAAVTISNVLPAANAGGPYVVTAGTTLTLSGSATDPGDDTLNYEWDFEYDGTFNTQPGTTTASGVDVVSPEHTYDTDGVFTVALRVTDDDGPGAISTAQVTVSAQTEPTPVPSPTPTPLTAASTPTPTPTPKVPASNPWGLMLATLAIASLAGMLLWRGGPQEQA